jgi:RNA polymerase sigma factor (sigma-70 family)
MERDSERVTPQSQQDTVSKISLLRHFIEVETESLLKVLCVFVFRANLDGGERIRDIALEVLSEVVQQALDGADRFDPTRSPRMWLLGIAANLIKRRQHERRKRAQREPCGRDLHVTGAENMTDDALFSQLAGLKVANLTDNLEIEDLLSLVSEDDRRVLRLAVIYELNCEMLAAELGIKSGAARVRLSRALERLRQRLI